MTPCDKLQTRKFKENHAVLLYGGTKLTKIGGLSHWNATTGD